LEEIVDTSGGWLPERALTGVAEVADTGAVGGWSAAHAGVAARKTAPAKVKAIKDRIIRFFSRRRTAAGGIKREAGVFHLVIIHQPQLWLLRDLPTLSRRCCYES
jgi:hypothetical protein